MALARFKDLVIDAVDPAMLGRFWGEVLGLTPKPLDDGDLVLSGPTPEHTVWINGVPEPVSVKQRVHIDVHAASLEDVLELGASPDNLESFMWKIVRDPEGGELCVFERQQVPDYRLYELGVDCVDQKPVAEWWAGVFGGTVGHGEAWSWVEDVPGMPFESIVFQPVPEPKLVKNRIHWDVTADEVDPLLQAGATVLRERDDEIAWTILADPEGNEFCVFTGQ